MLTTACLSQAAKIRTFQHVCRRATRRASVESEMGVSGDATTVPPVNANIALASKGGATV